MNKINSSDSLMRAVFSLFILCISIVSTPALAVFGNSNSGLSFDNKERFVPVDEAFPLNYFQQGNRVLIDWQVKPEYYLYQHRISISGEKVTVGGIQMRDGEPYKDEFFGDVNIYTTPLFVEVDLSDYQDGARLIVQYQGCAKAGFCYPPETRIIDITSFEFSDSNSVNPPASNVDSTSGTPTPSSSTPVSEDSNLASKLSDSWWTPLLFLALGWA